MSQFLMPDRPATAPDPAALEASHETGRAVDASTRAALAKGALS